MGPLAVGLIGLYLIAVGFNGKGHSLIDFLDHEVTGFAPWLIVVIVLAGLYSAKSTRPLVGPFIGLAVLAYLLKNEHTVVSQTTSLYEDITGSNNVIPFKAAKNG